MAKNVTKKHKKLENLKYRTNQSSSFVLISQVHTALCGYHGPQ